MPRILFTRTPSIAEGGPGHPFREGSVHDVAPRSARRWFDIGCAVPAPADPVTINPVTAEPVPLEPERVELVEAGGEAPPIVVPMAAVPASALPLTEMDIPPPPKPARQLRHAASGRWHVWEGETRLTERALPRLEAEALAAEEAAPVLGA